MFKGQQCLYIIVGIEKIVSVLVFRLMQFNLLQSLQVLYFVFNKHLIRILANIQPVNFLKSLSFHELLFPASFCKKGGSMVSGQFKYTATFSWIIFEGKETMLLIASLFFPVYDDQTVD